MPTTIRFKLDDRLKSVIEHASKGEQFTVPYLEKTTLEPSLLLAKDEGVYLLSAAIPPFMEEVGGKTRHRVAYALRR